MIPEEQRKKDAWSMLNILVKAEKLKRKRYSSLGDIHVLDIKHSRGDVHMSHILDWCELLGMPYIREDWDGNEQCNSNWDIVYFEYHDVEFFGLVTKEE